MSGDAKKKKVAVAGVSALILVAMVVAVAVGITHSKKQDHGESASTSTKAIQSICQPTNYKETCEKSLSEAGANTTDPKELIKIGFQVAMKKLDEALDGSATLEELAKDPSTKGALQVCDDVLNSAIEDLAGSFDKMGPLDFNKMDEYVEDVKVWLSGALSHQQTCIDAFENTTGDAGDKMKGFLKTSKELTSNGLAMVGKVSSLLSSLSVDSSDSHRRRLLAAGGGGNNGKSKKNKGGVRNYKALPAWIEGRRMDLLTASPQNLKPNAVVAKDGSGQYKTITDALKMVPKNSNGIFIIYVKAGVYAEYVTVDKTMQNVFMIGDGPTKTRITGSKNFADGVKTMQTATFAAVGDFFIAKGIAFENTAGAAKHQAVALRVQSDFSIFYNCDMDAYQDTLYTQTYRQFYRDCTIRGTIDFIFGDALALFQNCRMLVRKPMDNQACMVTAQGRDDPNEITGIVLQNCTIGGEADYLPVKDKNKAYLGRPWKKFARTIFMSSQIDGIIAPEGYMQWQDPNAPNNHQTCLYAEFGNRGPGADTSKRVNWPTFKRFNAQQAQAFTAGKWFEGDRWVRPSGVPYVSGMINA